MEQLEQITINLKKWIVGINWIKCLNSDIGFSTILEFFKMYSIWGRYNKDENRTTFY